MAAKLTWEDRGLKLGIWELAYVMSGSRDEKRYMYVIDSGHVVSEEYESEADCRQDCETEVRRLLREAGVTLED